jgi:hypothetical protein
MKKKFSIAALAALYLMALAFTGCKDPEPEPVHVSSVEFTATPTAPLITGDEFTFTVNVLPANADNRTVTWRSSNAAVASVTDAGVVKALTAGETVISATANDISGKKAEYTLTVNEPAPPPAEVTITPADGLDLAAVNEIRYSEAADEEGEARDISVTVAATRGIAKIDLKLTTDNPMIAGVLTEMGIEDGFELGTLSEEVAGALTGFFGEGLPVGDEIRKEEVKIDFSGLLTLIKPTIPGGINQFDIEITATDALRTEPLQTDPAEPISETQTLRLKFTDDTTVWVGIQGIGEEPVTVNISEVADVEIPTIDIQALTGIENLLVDIDGATIDEVLAGIGLGGEFDLANPTAEVAASLAGLAAMNITLPSGEEVKGQTELAFDLSSFLPMLAALGEGAVDFKITVKDAAGHEDTQTLTLNFFDDLKLTIAGDGIGEVKEIKMSEMADASVKIDIAAPQGIETFKIQITSSSEEFMGALAVMGMGGEFDLADPGEELGAALTDVGLINGADVKGKTELLFDISSFVPIIFNLVGPCTADFKLTVTDTKEKTETATVKLNLVDDTATGE